MIHCVVPQALADELYDRLSKYPRDDPNVEPISDRRGRGGNLGDHAAHTDRRRQRPKGSFPPIDPPAGAA